MLTVKIPSIDILIGTVETRQGSQQPMQESIVAMYLLTPNIDLNVRKIVCTVKENATINVIRVPKAKKTHPPP